MRSSLKLLKSPRFRRASGFFLILLLAAIALPSISQAVFQSSDIPEAKPHKAKLDFVPGEILVRFRSADKAKRGETTLESLAVEGRQIPMRVERFGGSDIVEGLRLARVAPADTMKAIAALNSRADVLYAEPNYIRRKSALPTDTRFSDQWGLKNTGQSGGKVGADIHAEQAWNISTGSKTVVVGVIDEGIDINHEDLKDNIWKNPGETPGNGIDDDGNGFTDDVNGWDFYHNDKTVFDSTGTYPADETDAHGTHVAGIIGATGNNSLGVVGVNWQVSLMSLKVLGPDGGSSSTIIQAYNYARMMRLLYITSGGAKGANIRVLNNSYGGSDYSQAELDAIRALGDDEILFVAAAGNEARSNDTTPVYPSSYISPHLISVAASSRSDLRPSFTNFGAATVHMAAPGFGILSTTPNNTYDYADGTSMAAPHVSGAAALISARDGIISARRMRSLLLYSGDVLETQNFYTLLATGRRLNAFNALQSINDNDTTRPAAVGNFQMSNPYFRNVSLSWVAPGDDGNVGQAAVYELRFSDTDLSSPQQFELARPLAAPLPKPAGGFEGVSLEIPWRHPSGFIGIRAVDNVGNQGPITSIPVSIGADVGDPYIITESPATPLSTGGTPLGLVADDEYKIYNLPFALPFFGRTRPFSNVTVSTNGALYFGFPPSSINSGPDDAENTANRLGAYNMIAGLWDDLRTDRRPGDDIYIVKPDADRIIFRWQAVTYDTPIAPGVTRGENPVNFEIELNRDGTITVRYGDGNQKVFSVVGAGGGMPDSYLVDSHTAKFDMKDLTNAPTVTFAFRPLPPASADLEVLAFAAAPNPVTSGQQLMYSPVIRNRGPNEAAGVTVTTTLPAGTSFVSCVTNKGTCTGPPPGTNGGTVTANLGSMYSGEIPGITIRAQVNAAAGTTLTGTTSITSSSNDPSSANNSATTTNSVIADVVFPGTTEIAAGQLHSLGLKGGEVWAWGDNAFGQLGDGTTSSLSSYPVLVSNLFYVSHIAAGANHNVALKYDGTVWTWGANESGQLGDGTTVPSRNVPVQVSGLTNVIAVAAGDGHTLALKSDMTVWAWGSNSSGQLGIGSSDNNPHPTPVQVSGLTNVTRIAAGSNYSFAMVGFDTVVWAWGNNAYGKLGAGTLDALKTSPVVGAGSNTARFISARSDHVIGLGNGVWTWGRNDFGQLGRNFTDTQPHEHPGQVGNFGAGSVAAGSSHTLALQLGGPVLVWGQNNYGQLGIGSSDNNPHPTPIALSGLTNVSAVAAGNWHSMVLMADGTIRTWGNNAQGQLGDGTRVFRSSPSAVVVGPKVATPTLSPDGGRYGAALNVTVNCATSGALLHYTTNGNPPTESDPVILPGASINVPQGMTLSVRAWKNGMATSEIKSATYEISAPMIQFSQPSYIVSEYQLFAAITVTRSGDTSTPAAVKYTTSDSTGVNFRCDPSTAGQGTGVASRKCDYHIAVGRLRFAAGEMSKQIILSVVNDSYVEGSENLTVTLSDPTGATLSTPATATLTILDDDATASANPIDGTSFYVRQLYVDLLSREPDTAGWNGWTNRIDLCGQPNQAPPPCDRVTVGGDGFLRSGEFFDRQFSVLRLYRTGLGRILNYDEVGDLA